MKTGYGLRHAEIYPRQARVKFGHRKCFNFSEKGPPISSLEKNMRFSRRSKFPHFLEFPGNNLNAKIYPRMFFIHFHIVPLHKQLETGAFCDTRISNLEGTLHLTCAKSTISNEENLIAKNHHNNLDFSLKKISAISVVTVVCKVSRI